MSAKKDENNKLQNVSIDQQLIKDENIKNFNATFGHLSPMLDVSSINKSEMEFTYSSTTITNKNGDVEVEIEKKEFKDGQMKSESFKGKTDQSRYNEMENNFISSIGTFFQKLNKPK